MSYDIELKNKVTGETAKMRHPQYVRGGTVRAEVNERTGQLVRLNRLKQTSTLHATTAIIIMKQPTVTHDLHMMKCQHITLTERRALLKPNTESAVCMERLPLNQSQC